MTLVQKQTFVTLAEAKVCLKKMFRRKLFVTQNSNTIILNKNNLQKFSFKNQIRLWNLDLDKKFIKKMFGVKMHLGHQTRNRHPNMEPYIRGKREDFHIINLVHTLFCLQQVSRFLILASSKGKKILFVGTQKQATGWVEKAAKSCDSYFVNQKWLGGTLTNWQKIKKSLVRFNYLQNLEQHEGVEKLPKKKIASYKREKERLAKHIGGLQSMIAIPDIIIIVGQSQELNAVRECQKLGIKTIMVVDTDCNPLLADFVIPSNDDSMRSVSLILTKLVLSIRLGQRKLQKKKK